MQNSESLITLVKTLFINIKTYVLKKENRWKVIAIIIFFLAFATWGILRATIANASDLRSGYIRPARAVLYLGKDIYQDYPNNSFPAFFYCIIAFFAQFTYGIASFLWSIHTIGLYLIINAIILHIIRICCPDFKKVSYFIGPILSCLFLVDVLFMGQSDIMTLFFICVSLFYYLHNKDIKSGIWLAAGICFKVTPGLFIFYYLLKARFRILISTGIGIILFLFIVPSFYFGPAKSMHYIKEWSSMILTPYVKGEKIKSVNLTWKHTNQSLEAFLHRHFTDYAEKKYNGFHKHLRFLQISEATVNRLSKIIKFVILILLSAVVLIAKQKEKCRFPYEISLFLMAMLYFSPISWVSHYMLILVPYSVIVNTIVNLKDKDSYKKVFISLLSIATVFNLFSNTPYLQSFSLIFIGSFILFITMFIYVFLYLNKEKSTA